MQSPELSIIIISYNTRDMTLACLKSVYEQTKTPFELIVVDNASDDGSANAIADHFPQVTLIAESTNHGFAPAHDIALQHATAPWLLLLNPDTVVLNEAVDNLLAFATQNPNAGIWGGRTLFADHTLNPSSCWGKMTPFSLISRLFFLSNVFAKSETLNSEEIGRWPRNTVRNVDIVTGCLFLMRRTDWDALGGFDPVFSMYGEEADLCLRAKAAGFTPVITPDAEIIHYGGASDTVRSDKMVRLMRAKMELVNRHFSPIGRPIGRLALMLWPLSRALAWRLMGLSGRDGASEKAATWQDIWIRRREWKNGFSPS